MKTRTKSLLAIANVVVLLGACTGSSKTNVSRNEQSNSDKADLALQVAQPLHAYPRSQILQNIYDIEDAQAGTVLTTSFFFNQGVADPHDSCPSIGFPISKTDQVSNPVKVVGAANTAVVIGNKEPTGIYPGNGTGTYVICVDANGKGYANYDEGFVKTVAHPAKWDYDKHQVVLTGDATGNFHLTTP